MQIGKVDITATININGGVIGQTGALHQSISHALLEMNPEHHPALKAIGLLTRDFRIRESKKSCCWTWTPKATAQRRWTGASPTTCL